MSKIEIIIEGVDKASGVLDKVSGAAKTLGMIAVGTAAVGLAALGAGLGFAISEAMEAEQVQAQLNAVLESTGGIAGMTADEINAMATELSGMTTFTDDAIISASSLLLTFTNIGENVFPDATTAILDMSAAMGTDLQSATIQVGKALNDPIAGITALTRVGVSFTQEQKDVIAALVETGDVAAAQQLILAELNKEFGGSASAAAQTFAGRMTQLKNRIADLAEEIGGPLLAALSPFLDMLLRMAGDIGDKVTRFLEGVRIPLQYLGEAFRELGEGDIAGFFDRMRIAVFGLFQVFGANEETLETIRTIFDEIKRSIEANLTPFETLMEILDNFLPEETIMAIWNFVEGIQRLGEFIVENIEFVKALGIAFAAFVIIGQIVTWVSGLIAVIGGLTAAFTAAGGGIAGIVALLGGPLTVAIAAIALAIGALYLAWENNWFGIREKAAAVAEWFQTTGMPNINAAIESMKATAQTFADRWQDTFRPNIEAAANAFIPLFETVKERVSGAIKIMAITAGTFADRWQDTWLPNIKGALDIIGITFNTAKENAGGAIASMTTAMGTFNDRWLDTWKPNITGAIESIGTAFTTAKDNITGALGSIGAAISTMASNVSGALDSIGAAIDTLIGKIGELIAALGGISPPPIITPGSPTPLEMGLRGILSAVRELNPELDRLGEFGGVGGSSAYGLLNPGSGPGGPTAAGIGTTNYFNMTVNTSADVATVIRDFQMMQAMVGG